MLKCEQCKEEYEEKKGFSKYDKDFCTLKCIKKYEYKKTHQKNNKNGNGDEENNNGWWGRNSDDRKIYSFEGKVDMVSDWGIKVKG